MDFKYDVIVIGAGHAGCEAAAAAAAASQPACPAPITITSYLKSILSYLLSNAAKLQKSCESCIFKLFLLPKNRGEGWAD